MYVATEILGNVPQYVLEPPFAHAMGGFCILSLEQSSSEPPKNSSPQTQKVNRLIYFNVSFSPLIQIASLIIRPDACSLS